MQILLASGNRHKFAEFCGFFMQYEVFGQNNVELILPDALPQVDETGSTYEENALIKAAACAGVTNMPALSDDSGLEVAALSWGPGIHSARAARGSDEDRINWLLRKLGGLADVAGRRACFVSNIVMAFPRGSDGPKIGRGYFSAEGRCWGTIALEPRGSNGFGYDPVFVPDGYEMTFGELGPDEKSKISHRAIAMKGMAQMLPCMIKYRTVRDIRC